jgi:predicted ArsR family transcriptional regulator
MFAMSDLSTRSPTVAAVVDEFVETLEMLDILVLLSRGTPRSFTAVEIAVSLGIPDRAVQSAIDRLVASGLAGAEGAVGAPPSYFLAANDKRLSTALATILGAHASSRTELINHIALGANARRKAFADQYRRDRNPSAR